MQENKTQLNIFQRILGIMSELDYIQKGPKTVNGQYRYASHDQVTAAIHPLLVKYGVAAIPTVEESVQEGNRTVIKLLTSFINVDSPTDQFTTRSLGYGIDAGDKGPGKAVSYAFKMACLKTFCLETGEDPDNNANAAYEPEKCLDFDLTITPHIKDEKKLKKFLNECAESTKKHLEDVKREAVSRPEQFIEAFNKWSKK